MFVQHHFYMGESIQQSVVAMVAALLGMIPEGLYLLASVAMALSVIRLARKRVLIHEMSCIETLARVDVLCVDKTGTITENTMRVDEVIELNSASVGGRAALEKIIGDFARNMPADNITMEAMQTYFKENTGRSAFLSRPFPPQRNTRALPLKQNAYCFPRAGVCSA